MNASGGEVSWGFCGKTGMGRFSGGLSGQTSLFPKEIWCILLFFFFLRKQKLITKISVLIGSFHRKVLVGVGKGRNAGKEKNALISDLNDSNIRHFIHTPHPSATQYKTGRTSLRKVSYSLP